MSEGWASGAERPSMEGGLQYHIRCRQGDVARYALLPGDPERTDEAATLRGWREKYANAITLRRKDTWWRRLSAG